MLGGVLKTLHHKSVSCYKVKHCFRLKWLL